MKKHSLLMLLPFALIVTGCGANLSKGSVFNEKFMKYNFGDEIKKEETYEAPNKVDLNLGDDIQEVAFASYTARYLQKVTKTDGKFGIFNVYENKYVVPVEDWNYTGASKYVVLDNGAHVVILARTTDDAGVHHFKAFDEHGGEICSGEFVGETDTNLMNIAGTYNNPGMVARNSREDGELYRSFLKVDAELRAVIEFNVDGSIKQVISADKWLEAHPYYATWGGTSFAEYGHPEYIVQPKLGSNGLKYVVYNAKKNKIASQFVLPIDANVFPNASTQGTITIGDYRYYQRVTQLHERDDKYDLLFGGIKYNVETYRVNYLTGKTEEVKTNLFFASIENLGNTRNLYDKKGFYTLQYFNGIQEIRKDKSLGEPKAIVVNESLKEVADVTGIIFTKDNIRPFSDGLYLDNTSKIVYDKNFKEVGYYNGSVLNRVVNLSPNAGKGLIDDTGKVIFGGPSVRGIQLLNVKDHYAVQYEHKFALVKVADQKAVVIKEYSEEEYTFGAFNFGSYALATVVDNEAKAHYIDVTTGEISDVLAKENEADTMIQEPVTNSFFGSSVRFNFSMFQRTDKSCYILRNATKFALSYDTVK